MPPCKYYHVVTALRRRLARSIGPAPYPGYHLWIKKAKFDHILIRYWPLKKTKVIMCWKSGSRGGILLMIFLKPNELTIMFQKYCGMIEIGYGWIWGVISSYTCDLGGRKRIIAPMIKGRLYMYVQLYSQSC